MLGRVWNDIRDVAAEQLDVVDEAALALLTPGAICEPLGAIRMAHRLAGSLGSFGFPDASNDARELELLFGGLTTAPAGAQATLRIADLAVRMREHIAKVDEVFGPRHTTATPIVLDEHPDEPNTLECELVDVAVVEDDPITADLIVHALRQHGLSTRVLADGAEAADALAGLRPSVRAQVILLDIDLPSLNGLDVLGRLRSAGTLDHTKVIMLTARSGEAETIQAFDLGATDHVAKPFSHPVLVRRVKLALRR